MPTLTEEQINAINSIDEHVLVSAGAGSGKTFVLVERYIRVLASDPEASISDIIAVTYTRKAAEEMRSRLKARLSELAAQEESAELGRWLKCLAEVETARIGTIHSLCESILKNHPAEAGIDPGFEILDDLERAELLADSIDQALHFVIDKPREYFAELLDYPIEGLRLWLSGFLRSPLKYKESRRNFGDCSLESIRSFARKFIEEDIRRTLNEVLSDKQFVFEFAYLKDNAWGDPESKLGLLQTEMLSYLNILMDYRSYSEPERFQALVSLGAVSPARTLGGAAAKELRDCMRELRKTGQDIASSHRAELNESDSESFIFLRALIMLTDDALSRYEALKSHKQKLDFDDLIERCQLLLAGESHMSGASHSVRDSHPVGANHLVNEAHLFNALPNYSNKNEFALKQIGKELRAVLVDEFQDTNWTQAKMVTALASIRAKLFLIGDDKQSIYKFQGADVGTFNECKSYITSLRTDNQVAASRRLPQLKGGGQVMTLSQSFRSHPQIVNFVNNLFRSIFNAEPDAEEFKSRFQALRPARQSEAGDENPRIDILYTVEPEEEHADKKNELDRIEANLTAQWILDKIESKAPIFDKELKTNRHLDFSDFAILLQANSDFAIIERALAQAGVPYVSFAGSGFLDRQEILDLENMLKWLVCPQDSHALFAVLRSPMFGLSDDLLHELKAGKHSSLWQCLNQKVQEDGDSDFEQTRLKLQNLQRQVGKLSVEHLLRTVILTTGYDIILLATQTGKQKSRNLFKFLSLAHQHKHMGVSEFLESLQSMRELGVKNLSDAPLSADNAVKVMTIHKSKGLEFAAVALPRLGRGAHQMSDKLLFGKDLGIALDCTRDREEEKPAFFTAANNLSRRMDEEEKKRLLYVALTRARDYLGLIITSRCKRGTNFGRWLIEALNLPEPDGAIESQVMSAGRDDELCLWNISSPSAREFVSNADAALPPKENDSDTRTQSTADYSLLDELEAAEQTFTPVPWQALLRACPAESNPTVHATIAGNYFHLLMASLGTELCLPSEKDRRALLEYHEVSVHDHAQRELLLQDSERLLITFKNSSLYSLLKTSKRRLEENAYLIRRDGYEEELRPDLVFEDESGNWHIIDYKTDHFDIKQLAKQVASHQVQLARYVEDLHSLIGQRAKAWIYFAQIGRLELVDIASPMQLSLF